MSEADERDAADRSEASREDYVRINREQWTRVNAQYTDARAEHAWNEREITWGVWSTPEREVNVLPDVRGSTRIPPSPMLSGP